MKRWMICLLALLLAALPMAAASADTEITAKEQLNEPGRRVGVSTGSACVLIAEKELPNAEIVYYDDNAAAYEAVAQGKLDACVFDRQQMQKAIDEKLNAFIAEIKADGTMDDMYRRWVILGEETMPDIPAAEKTQLRLLVGTSGIVPPYSYYVGTKLSGFDIELAYRFAAWLGAELEFKVYDYGAIIPAAATGDVDCIMANLNITPERAEALPFSDELYEDKIGIMVRGDAAAAPGGFTSLDQLDGRRIGVQTGTTAADITLARLPNAQISYFTTFPDMAMALKTHKIDGFPGDGLVLKQMALEDPSLVILEEKLRSYDCGFVLAKNEKGEALCAEMNAWIADMRERGELDRILKKWTESPESERTVPDYKSLPAPRGTLTMTTEGTFPPMNYYRGEECVGMEIELCALFCEACGYGLNVTTMDFDGMLAAVQAGKVDFAISGIAITEERKESVLFSDPYYTGGTMMAVLKIEYAQVPGFSTGRYTALSQLATAQIGVQTGQSFDALVKEKLPQAKIVYVNSKADLLNSLISGKIDAFAVDEPVLKALARQNSSVAAVPEYLDRFEFGYIFPKTEAGQALCGQFSDFIEKLKADGTLEALEQKWISETEKKDMPDISSLSPVNGTLTMATEALYEPFTYIQDGKIVGYDIEIAVRFCQEYGYGLEIVDMNFSGILPAVTSEKCDFGGAGITITPERAESVLFSVPNYSGGTVLAVLKGLESEEESGFWADIRASFNKTFIREDRWRLFVQGVINTLIITILSILCGTALGFGVFMLRRKGNPIANGATRFSMWLVQGMPMVVLLMILYYIIFGSVSISGLMVAVIGFTLTFGASVFSLLKMGVGAVDNGQYEAAYALGYSSRRTFFKIILPQALPHVMSAYKGEIVGLIKATSIVGYIAVQDLTKMGDIVRSRTYEAFFPLIAITVIYFVLEGLLGVLVSRIGVNFNPKRRKAADILKGVKTDD